MLIFKAVKDNTAVFINPEKFPEFWKQGYTIYRVNDLEDESKDEIIDQTKYENEVAQYDNKVNYIRRVGS